MVPLVLLFAGVFPSAAPANVWTRSDAVLEGRRWDIPLGFDPVAKQFLVLGGRSSFADYKKPRSYDVLSWSTAGKWKNEFPNGVNWGPEFGPAMAPGWKDEHWMFRDTAGNTRPNWTVYGTFSLGQKYDYDPDTKAFYFFARGRTFKYDPAEREWTDLDPSTHPEEGGGILLWSSMVYDRSVRKFVLFGGGNIPSTRGDAGTWLYSPTDNRWEAMKPDVQPPARANSRLAYDPESRKVVLFGGDRLDQLSADTWVFDSTKGTWEERKPAVSPSPRAGHALMWMPKAKKVLLLGGYTYTSTTDYVASLYKPLPLEAWTYDVAANSWQLVGTWDAKSSPAGPANFFQSAAIDHSDTVLSLDSANRAWTCQIDSKPLDYTARGVKPGTITRRTGSHDPAWYREGIPAPDPDRVTADLKAIPANRWVTRPTPKRPGMNMDWGSAVFDPVHDQILRFSGGHSAYSGTAPVVYDIKTDRYSLPFAPEYPVEYVYSNDQVHGEWSFAGNPWMTGHTYKSTGFDPLRKSLVFAPHDYTYFFHSETGKWSRSESRNPYRSSFYTVTLVSAPTGCIAWGDQRTGDKPGLWKLTDREWKSLPLSGELPAKSADRHGLAYDSKRDRLLFFSDYGPKAGNVAEYSMATGLAKWLDPKGADSALVHCRETVYLPDADLVLIAGRTKNAAGNWQWMAYDCTANAWIGLSFEGDDPVGKAGSFNNSMGLMYDPARKLVWAVGQYSQISVLRILR